MPHGNRVPRQPRQSPQVHERRPEDARVEQQPREAEFCAGLIPDGVGRGVLETTPAGDALTQWFEAVAKEPSSDREAVIQQKIDQNRGKVRVAADLSAKGIAEIEAEERMQTVLAEQALTDFEVLARGVSASPGAAKGEIVFSAPDAVDAERLRHYRQRSAGRNLNPHQLARDWFAAPKGHEQR